MSMAHLQNAMRAQASLANQSRTFSRLGVVSAYDPNTYSVKVTFQPDGNETGWIPLGTLQVGSSFGIYAAPNIGDQIEVRFQEGDRDTGVAGPVVFDNQSPPAQVAAGEIWLIHKSGAFFKLLNVGGFVISDGQGATVSADGSGNLTYSGNKHSFTGPVWMNGHRVDETHKHTNTQPGLGLSGTPQ